MKCQLCSTATRSVYHDRIQNCPNLAPKKGKPTAISIVVK
jgi:hypothetical protein